MRWTLGILLSASALAASAPSSDFYAEQVYQSRLDNTATSLRFRQGLTALGGAILFFGGGAELQNFSDGRWSGPGDSYLHAGPGLRGAAGPFAAVTEVRFRYFPDRASRDPAADWRVLLVTGRTAVGSPWGAVSPFLESYAEFMMTSADRWNAIADGFLRAGLRLPVGSSTNLDLFLEPFVSLDRVRHYYNNHADLKATLRLQGAAGPLVLGLQASLVENAYFRRGDFESNPFRTRNGGFRVLAVIGGSW